MSFSIPAFNLDVNIYDFHTTPMPPVALRGTCLGNLATGRVSRVVEWEARTNASPRSLAMSSCLLVPKLTDIRDAACAGGEGDLLEVPAGSGRIYWVTYVEDIGKGFDNEHRMVIMQKVFTYGPFAIYRWPTPMP